MATKTTVAEGAEGIDQATHEAAVSAAGQTGAKAEKDRIKAILACDEGKARPKAAMSCAMNTDMSLEDAQAFLADLAEEKAEQPSNDEPSNDKKPKASGQTPFDAAMNGSDNPEVGAGGDEAADEDDDTKASASILADYAGATGRSKKSA